MKRLTSTLAFALAVAVSAALMAACPNPLKKKLKIKSVWGQVFDITQKQDSARGVQIWVQKGAVYNSQDEAAIEAGLTRTFDNARCLLKPGGQPYDRALNHADYIVAILKATDVDSRGNPSYRVPCNQYCGTEYDKGGYILVAGQVVAVGQPYGNIIALPDSNSNFAYMEDGAAYEAEHIVFAWNDINRYEQTKTHGAGTGHPLMSGCKKNETDSGSGQARTHLPYTVEINGVRVESIITVAE